MRTGKQKPNEKTVQVKKKKPTPKKRSKRQTEQFRITIRKQTCEKIKLHNNKTKTKIYKTKIVK